MNSNNHRREFNNQKNDAWNNNQNSKFTNNYTNFSNLDKKNYNENSFKNSFGNNNGSYNDNQFFRKGFIKKDNNQKQILYSNNFNNNNWYNRYSFNSYYNSKISFNNSDDLILKEHLTELNKKKNFEFKELQASTIKIYDSSNCIISENSNQTSTNFSDISNDIDKKLTSNIVERMQFSTMTPIQSAVIPYITKDYDVVGCAQTGSGKTLAFLMPIINKMLTSGYPAYNMERKTSYPVVLILAPVRELALQIFKVAKLLTYETGIRVTKIYGGEPHKEQLDELKNGIDILVSTTGRLLDYLGSGVVNLSCLKYLVIDEADRILDMGFEKQLNEILSNQNIPSINNRQNLLFSATFSKEIKRTIDNSLKNNYIKASNTPEDYVLNDNIDQKFYYVEEENKSKQLHLILQECVGNAIIFLDKKRSVEELHYIFKNGGYNCLAIHGDKSQSERNSVMEKFKTGKVPILIATDVIGRGIDFPDVSYIFNYDTPKNLDDYIHRIGRTGRCGNKGKAISFINENSIPIISSLYKLLKKYKKEIPDFLESMYYNNGNKNNVFANKNYKRNNFNSHSNYNNYNTNKNTYKNDNYNNNNNNLDNSNYTNNNSFNYKNIDSNIRHNNNSKIIYNKPNNNNNNSYNIDNEKMSWRK